jgi:hypothetical protein
MVSTALAIPALPAHLAQYVAKHADENAGAAGGIKAGSWPRISIGGSKFSIKANGESTLITDPTNPDLPKMQLEMVVVGHNPMVSKTFYDGDFEEGDKDEPDCSSDDGMTPDSHITQKQSVSCATCPKNVWGSKISKMSGKQIKACSDNKRLVVLQAAALDDDAYEFSVKPSSLKDWAIYVKELTSRSIPVSAVVTLIYFDPSATYPKCMFKFGRYLTPEELAVVEERKVGDDVQLIASPRRTGPQLPPGAIPIQPAAVAPAPAPAPAPTTPPPAAAVAPPPAPAPAPVVPPAPADPFAGQPPHVQQAVVASGGLGSVGGDSVYKALTGKDAPTVAAQQVPPPPPPPDPFAGQPAHVEPAVKAAGGLGTPTGDATYKALTGKDVPGSAAASAAAAPAKRGRGKATTPTPPVTAAPTAPAAAAPPPAASMVAAPPAQVVAPGAQMDIEAMLKQALDTPVGQ